MEREINIDTINYRLDKMEEMLSQLKDVVISDKLQQRELDNVKAKVLELTEAINAHDRRIKDVEIRPAIQGADKWKQIVDATFKFLIGAVLSFIAIKFGLNN
jgi:hypothetical protein